MSNKKLIIFFDDICILCNSFVKLLLKADRSAKFNYAPLGGQTANELLPESFERESVILLKQLPDETERIYLRSNAVLSVFRELGSFWKLFLIFKVIPAPIRDWFYDLVAKTRYRIFGKYDVCPLPPSEVRDRFLP